MNKAQLRDEFRRRLRDLSPQTKKEEAAQISRRLREYLKNRSGYWSLYYPMKDEPDLLECFDSCSSVQWVFPRVSDDSQLQFYSVNSKDDFIANSWGLFEPETSDKEPLASDSLAGSIIPALAYDENGVRLGRGGGYYDRALKTFQGAKIGVAFTASVSPDPLPKEDHDQTVDVVVCSNQWIEVSEVNHGHN